MSDIVNLIRLAVKKGASDLHLVPGMPPVLRVNGQIGTLVPKSVSAPDGEDLARAIMTEDQYRQVQGEKHIGFAIMVSGVGRLRVEAFYTMGRLGAAIRLSTVGVPVLEDLGTPPVLETVARAPNGLVLVTGPTGAGKTTTMNAVVDFINRERACRIATIEDPIEFLHTNKRSIVVQQEVHADTPSFPTALMHVLRQDPDVIVVGEMRSLETISTALTAAETGHLVLATLHTNSAAQTVDRIVDVFPPYQQNQVRVQLAATLQAIISQRLLPKAAGDGRVLAYEVLVNCPAVRNIVREGKTQQLTSVMQSNADLGMCTMDNCIVRLYQEGTISFDTAMDFVENKSLLSKL